MRQQNGYLLKTVNGCVVRLWPGADIEYVRKFRWRVLKGGRLELVRELRRGEDDWVETIEKPRQALASKTDKKARLR